MKRLVVLLLLLLVVGNNVNGEDNPRNGYWWNDNSRSFKLGYVVGYVEAMVNFQDTMTLQCLAAKNGGVVPEKYPGAEVLEACVRTGDHYDFNEIRFGQLVDGVDEFYKDFRNKNIHINVAMGYVRDQLKGKSAKELEEDLAAYRRTAAGK